MSEEQNEGPDSLDFTPERLLSDALAELNSGNIVATKAIIVFLNDEPDGAYNTTARVAGMKHSEVIALLEVYKQKVMLEMNQLMIVENEDDDEEDETEDA